jgi:hypothetical protein
VAVSGPQTVAAGQGYAPPWIGNNASAALASGAATSPQALTDTTHYTLAFRVRLKATGADQRIWDGSNFGAPILRVNADGTVQFSIGNVTGYNNTILERLAPGATAERSFLLAVDRRTAGNALGGAIAKLVVDGVHVPPPGGATPPDDVACSLSPVGFGATRRHGAIDIADFAVNGGLWFADDAALDPEAHYAAFFDPATHGTLNWSASDYVIAGVKPKWCHFGDVSFRELVNLGSAPSDPILERGTGAWTVVA